MYLLIELKFKSTKARSTCSVEQGLRSWQNEQVLNLRTLSMGSDADHLISSCLSRVEKTRKKCAFQKYRFWLLVVGKTRVLASSPWKNMEFEF